jgi:glc operon protein GlcG
MKSYCKAVLVAMFATIMIMAIATAQQPTPTPPPTIQYGAPIGLEAAKKVMTAAEAEAVKNNWAMAIAILDSTGHLVMLHKMDNTQYGTAQLLSPKTRPRARFTSGVPRRCLRT